MCEGRSTDVGLCSEIRTPLTSIMGMIELLRCTHIDEMQQTYLHVLTRSAKLLLSLVNNILDMTKMELGPVFVEKTPFRLLQLVEEVVDIAGGLSRAHNVRIDFHPEFPPDLAAYMDTKCVKQALLNLLSNAIKFSYDDSQVEFYVTLVARDLRQRYIFMFEVVDHGIGMTKATLDHLFQPFAQGRDISVKYGKSL